MIFIRFLFSLSVYSFELCFFLSLFFWWMDRFFYNFWLNKQSRNFYLGNRKIKVKANVWIRWMERPKQFECQWTSHSCSFWLRIFSEMYTCLAINYDLVMSCSFAYAFALLHHFLFFSNVLKLAIKERISLNNLFFELNTLNI